jgi:phosphotriesterase-related protein
MKYCIGLCTILMMFGLYAQGQEDRYIMTVRGKLAVGEMGKTLVHEHMVTNFDGTPTPNQSFTDQQMAIKTILPYLHHLKDLGYSTLFECTPSYIGKNVRLLQKLSELSGIHIVTNTGYYAAVDKKYLPESIQDETVNSLAALWHKEWQEGIADTGIRPGFIKLGVGTGKLDDIEQKIFRAGMLLSKKTGLAVAVHTGDGASMASQAGLAEESNFDFNRLIWVHAQNGEDDERIRMAKKGIWISLDGVSKTRIDDYVAMIVTLQEQGLLSKLLLSHDDGWAVVNNKGEISLTLFENGNDTPYQTISEVLLKKLYEHGFTKEQLDLIFIENPKRAFALPH